MGAVRGDASSPGQQDVHGRTDALRTRWATWPYSYASQAVSNCCWCTHLLQLTRCSKSLKRAAVHVASSGCKQQLAVCSACNCNGHSSCAARYCWWPAAPGPFGRALLCMHAYAAPRRQQRLQLHNLRLYVLVLIAAAGDPLYQDPVEGRCCACGMLEADTESGKLSKCSACKGVSCRISSGQTSRETAAECACKG
jgi:hypothetical protein